MKALVLTSSYPLRPGSLSGCFVRDLLRALTGRGWSFEVVTPAASAPGTPERDAGIAVWEAGYPGAGLTGGLAHGSGIPEALARAPWKWGLAPGLAWAMARLAERRLSEARFDLVWSHWMIPAGAIAARLARRHGRPHLATAHGGDVHLLERIVRIGPARRALARLWSQSALAAPAPRTAARLGAALGREDVRVCALPAFLEPQGPASGAPRLLFLGRFEPIKGPDLLLEAMAALPAGDYRELTLAGAGSLEPALRSRAAGIPTPISFPGVVRDEAKAGALVRAHAVVIPSRRLAGGRREGLPHAAIEALASGRPVIAPREGALADLIDATGAGLLYDSPGSDAARVEALAGALRALARSPERFGRLALSARAAGARFLPARALPAWDARLAACAGGGA